MLQKFQPAQTQLERMHKNGDIDGLIDLFENKIRHVYQIGTLQAGIQDAGAASACASGSSSCASTSPDPDSCTSTQPVNADAGN